MTVNARPEDRELVLAPLEEKVDHVRGAPAGRLISEYGDYECPYLEARGFAESCTCRHANPRANADLDTYGRSGSRASMVTRSSEVASDRDRRPPCPCAGRDRAPGRRVDSSAGPEPADGLGGAGRRVAVPDQGPGRAVHRGVRRGAGCCRDRGGEDPAPEPSGERLSRKVGAHSPGRVHRSDADRRAAAPAGGAGSLRRAL